MTRCGRSMVGRVDPAGRRAVAVLALAMLVGALPCLGEVSDLQRRAATHLEEAFERAEKEANRHAARLREVGV